MIRVHESNVGGSKQNINNTPPTSPPKPKWLCETLNQNALQSPKGKGKEIVGGSEGENDNNEMRDSDKGILDVEWKGEWKRKQQRWCDGIRRDNEREGKDRQEGKGMNSEDDKEMEIGKGKGKEIYSDKGEKTDKGKKRLERGKRK